MPHFTAAHVQPDLMLAAVVCWAISRGTAEGSLAGFVAGISLDLLSGAPFGVHTFVMVIVGIAAGLGAAMVPSEHAMLLPGMSLLCTVLQQAMYVLLLRAAGWPVTWPQALMPIVIPSALLNLLLTMLLYPLVARFRRQVAPEEPSW